MSGTEEQSTNDRRSNRQEPTAARATPPFAREVGVHAVDPQLDANLLQALIDHTHVNHAAAKAYALANESSGLSVNRSAYREFLQSFSKDQFNALRQEYRIRLIREIPLEELQSTSSRLQRAFTDGRTVSDADARVAASAYLRGERLATNDRQFFYRARDLGLDVEYVGTGEAAARAANYIPRPVTIPSP